EGEPNIQEIYRETINKIFIIDLYTNWEQFIKKSIRHIYDDYKNILLQEPSLIRRIFNDKIKKARDIKLDENGAIDFKKLLTNSNNMKFLALREIISSIGLNTNYLSEDLKEDKGLSDSIKQLKGTGISFMQDQDTTQSEPSDISNIIYTIVELRNEYAHTGKSNTSFFNECQMDTYCTFFEKLISRISIFLSNELKKIIFEYYSTFDKSIKLEITDIIRENTRTSLSALKISSNRVIKNPKAYYSFLQEEIICIDNKSVYKYYPANLSKIENLEEIEIDTITKGEQFILLDTQFKIRRSKNCKLTIYLFKHKKDYAHIKFG
ncbi:TPA: HEPN domain-containing protein, partial [Mannheimia haemolytica]